MIASLREKTSIFLVLMIYGLLAGQLWANNDQVHVGLILDMKSSQGKIFNSIVTMAVSDFYDRHENYTTRLVVHERDSRGEPLEALSAALDFVDKLKIDAIIGGQTTIEEKLLAELGGKARIPVISLSEQEISSPSFRKYPFSLQIAKPQISQFEVMAAIAEAFDWKDVTLVYEGSDIASDITCLTDSFQEKNVNVKHKRDIATLITEDEMVQELEKILISESRIIIVHASRIVSLYRLLVNAKNIGLMNKGFAWFLTATTTNVLQYVDHHSTVDAMQGVIGLKPYIPPSKGLQNLASKFRRLMFIENPNIEVLELSSSAIRAYDSIWALAKAAERVHARPEKVGLTHCRASKNGYLFLKEVLQSRFSGLSGQFWFLNGKLLVDGTFEIVNFVGKGHRRIKLLNYTCNRLLSRDDLEAIVWPGGSTINPKGRSMLQSRTKLRVAVSYRTGFSELVHIELDINSKSYNITGFCVDVFKAAMNLLSYQMEVEFLPSTHGEFQEGYIPYDNLISDVFLEKYDAAIGDITILSNRSKFVDFTQPFSDIGIGMLVRDENNNPIWVFLKPFSPALWLTAGGFFLLFGFVVWAVEHPNNGRFQGFYSEQIGNTLWFAFSTLVFNRTEELKNYLSKFVYIVWVFVVLILTSTYTATLTSMMTVKGIQLDRRTSYIGYQRGSFLARGVINNLDFKGLKPLLSTKDFEKALSEGSKHGGVSAIIDEIPYLKIFLAQYENDKFSIIKTESTTSGFGFAFQKGSPYAQDMSTAIEKLRESGELENMERKWFHSKTSLISDDSKQNPNAVDLVTFRGLFFMVGSTFAMALVLFLCLFLKQNWHNVKYMYDLVRNLCAKWMRN